MDPIKLVRLIVCEASRAGFSLSALRLVKFMYLADLYSARERNGKTITGWPWAFVYFGPYCGESIATIQSAVERGLIDARTFESRYDDKDHFQYSCPNGVDDSFEGELSSYVHASLREVIEKWGDDTSGLLDYVYFETEPMWEARKGDILDFSKARIPPALENIKTKQLPQSTIDKAKKIVASLRDQYRAKALQISFIAAFDTDNLEVKKAIEKLDDPDLEPGLIGTAGIKDAAD